MKHQPTKFLTDSFLELHASGSPRIEAFTGVEMGVVSLVSMNLRFKVTGMLTVGT